MKTIDTVREAMLRAIKDENTHDDVIVDLQEALRMMNKTTLEQISELVDQAKLEKNRLQNELEQIKLVSRLILKEFDDDEKGPDGRSVQNSTPITYMRHFEILRNLTKNV